MQQNTTSAGRQKGSPPLSSGRDVGRKRKSPIGTKIVNPGFKFDEHIVRALDDEAARLNLERAPGAPKLSLSDVIKQAIDAWLETPRKLSKEHGDATS